jgi:MOSC domain-containing protein YiiM
MQGRIFQINRSPGGVPKLAVRKAQVTELGLVGDEHSHPEIHGGPDRAVCLYSLERIVELQSEGHHIYPGSAGENITISGLDWSLMTPGRQLWLGDEVQVEITKYTSPCNSISASFLGGDYGRISQKTHPGYARVYTRVRQTGSLVVGQSVRLLVENTGDEVC